jgi:aspartate beta-hydroxylase
MPKPAPKAVEPPPPRKITPLKSAHDDGHGHGHDNGHVHDGGHKDSCCDGHGHEGGHHKDGCCEGDGGHAHNGGHGHDGHGEKGQGHGHEAKKAHETSVPKAKTPSAAGRKTPEPSAAFKPAQRSAAAQPKKKGLDYSKFNAIEDSDDERPVPKQEHIQLPYGCPREMVSRSDFDNVWRLLLQNKDLPFTPTPDLEQMWGYYKYGGMDEQALLDQACEHLAKIPSRLEPATWKANTYGLTKKLELESRMDEARMWSIICISRFPKDPDAYYNQGVLLNKMCDNAKFGGSPSSRLFSLDGAPAKTVPTTQYCSLYSRAAIAYYRRCLKVDAKQRPAYINLIGCLERNEPNGWYDDVHEVARAGVKHGIWYNMWQRPPHLVPSLCAKPWHDPLTFPMCRALNEHYPTIRAEYDAYINKLVNRKDWDDSDRTPGLGDVGGREGALHDGGLTKSGHWREVPLFTNCTLQREYAELFPETVKILRTYCGDATGSSLCGCGDVIFSVLTPGTRLRPHCGPSNARLTCHLGIWVPRSLEQGLRIRVAADEPRGWQEGRCLVFDDSFEHEVFYEEPKADEPYPGDRVVLLANFWHHDFEFKNDPEWRQKSDAAIAALEVESLPQTAMMKHMPKPALSSP